MCRPPQAAAGSLSHLVCFGFRLRVHHPLETRTWPFACLQRLLGAATLYTGWGQHSVLVRALPGSADRDVGRPSICPITPVMWLELDHTKHRCFVLRRSSPNPAGVMHGVALHSHALCYLRRVVRWHKRCSHPSLWWWCHGWVGWAPKFCVTLFRRVPLS